MSIYTIGDLHLSLGTDKPMDIFPGWDGYLQKLEDNWRRLVRDGDTVVVPGDISWAMGLPASLADFTFIHQLPGKKILLKGNHDYWWTTKNKMDNFLAEHGLDSIAILSNNSFLVEGVNICGSRSWFFEDQSENDAKIRNREIGRLNLSLQSAVPGHEIIAFLHYPPLYRDFLSQETVDLLRQYGVKRCYYGHIHSKGIQYAFNGVYDGIDFQLVSCDGVGFCPVLVQK